MNTQQAHQQPRQQPHQQPHQQPNQQPHQQPNQQSSHQPSQQQSLQQPSQSQTIQVNKELLEKIDPFNILAKEKLSIPQLRQKYKKLSLVHHPDRGGSVDNFSMLQKAIKNIDTLVSYHSQKQTHSSLKNNFKRDMETAQKTSNVDMGKKFSIDTFNKIYTSNRIQSRNDEGYGSLMGKHSNIREDITIKPMGSGKVTKDSFNTNFNEYKQQILGDIQVRPNALPEPTTLSKELLYKELGDSKKNFSNARRGYTDFKQAHIDNTLINTNVAYEKYNSIEDLEYARSNNVTLNDEDRRLIQQQEEIDAQNEVYRKQTLEQNDRLMYENFKKTNKLLL